MTKTTREIYMEKALHARAGARDGVLVPVHCEDLIALLEDATAYGTYVPMTAGSARWHVATALAQAGVVSIELRFAPRPPRADGAQTLSLRVMRPPEEVSQAWVQTLTEVLRRAARVDSEPTDG